MATAIDTGKVSERRKLRLNSLDDIRAEVEQLAKSREIRTLGNLTSGQILAHLATSMTKSIDGYASSLPAAVRAVFRLLFKNKFLNTPMSAGFKLPAKAQAELIPGADESGTRAGRHPPSHPTSADGIESGSLACSGITHARRMEPAPLPPRRIAPELSGPRQLSIARRVVPAAHGQYRRHTAVFPRFSVTIAGGLPLPVMPQPQTS